MENQRWFLLHDNAPVHRSVSVKDFSAKNNVTTMERPPYSPDLASADFYTFARMISALKGRRLCDASDIIKNTKEELKRLFLKWLPGKYQTTLQSPVEVFSCTRELF